MNKLTEIKERVKSFKDDPQLFGVIMRVDEMNFLISLLEEKDKALADVEDYLHIISGLKEIPSSVESYVDLAIETINKVSSTSSNNEGDS